MAQEEAPHKPLGAARPPGPSLRLGVDVGGTFTDVLVFDEDRRETYTAKVPSTPDDSSRGVLHGIERACESGGLDPRRVSHVLHGTTVATNAMLTRQGARVGLVTTRGYRQVLQIARSFVPGGLGGWVIYEQSEPLAPLELTVEANERIGADGSEVEPLDEDKLRDALAGLSAQGVEALTVSLINAFANDAHEQRIRAIATEALPGVPVSLSSEVIPEMQEYERTVTTVANSYVRPVVERYVSHLERDLREQMGDMRLHILRSDGGLASAEAAQRAPVNLLMSGPAGGVAGAIWVARQAGFENLLTLDMGGTSTDVCLVQNGEARLRRETTVGDITVRAVSVDVRTVGAGGGSIAHVPELTGALRVGPQSAGADPGPAAYGRGGDEATVTDANVVLGYLPGTARLGGEMGLDRERARAAVQKIADARGLSLHQAAAGIVDIVNENMCGALRLVSVEQGHDPRDFALVAFGGAGPLHANALGRLIHAWPVIVPPGPGVLCAYGDATTRLRDEASRSFIRPFSDTGAAEVAGVLRELAELAADALVREEGAEAVSDTRFEADLRYHGQGLLLSVAVDPAALERDGLESIGREFDRVHEQLFTFALGAEKELVNLRAVVQGAEAVIAAARLDAGDRDPTRAVIGTETVFVEGRERLATIFDRAALRAGDRVAGPAIVTEMDSTTWILSGHHATVDALGNLLIRPDDPNAE